MTHHIPPLQRSGLNISTRRPRVHTQFTVKMKRNKINREEHETIKRKQTIPSGSDPVFVEWYIISSNWNVFEPGAAHTAQKEKKQ